MEIKPKTHTNRSEIDDVIESAIEWQDRARQNHGITLDITKCIGFVLKFGSASSMNHIAELGIDVLEIINEERKKC